VFPIATTEKKYPKFKTSSNIKILNPLIPFKKNNRIGVDETFLRAHEVMSSSPPQSLHNSKFQISRLSPIFPLIKPQQKKKTTYLKRKYADCIENGRGTDFSVDFTRPVRDYFVEASSSYKDKAEIAGSIRYSQENTEKKIEEVKNSDFHPEKSDEISNPKVKIQSNNYQKPKYTSMLLPIPNSISPKFLKNLSKIQSPPIKKILFFSNTNCISESLQTDQNSFEFDEWELDPND
jgi:hypothetical protein